MGRGYFFKSDKGEEKWEKGVLVSKSTVMANHFVLMAKTNVSSKWEEALVGNLRGIPF